MPHQDALDPVALLATLRAAAPLVHAMTSAVSAPFTANVLLAAGVSPVLAEAEAEVEALAATAGALLLNLGTLTPAREAAMARAAAARSGRPWVLDPVGAGALSTRRDAATRLLGHRPALVKGNASEIIALAGLGPGGRGVDSTASAEQALPAARALARAHRTLVAVTGATDFVTDGARVLAVRNGHPWLTRITGSGCAVGGLCAAALAVTPDARLSAVAAALALFGLAAELAAARGAAGPGTLPPLLLDALNGMGAADAASGARIEDITPSFG